MTVPPIDHKCTARSTKNYRVYLHRAVLQFIANTTHTFLFRIFFSPYNMHCKFKLGPIERYRFAQ